MKYIGPCLLLSLAACAGEENIARYPVTPLPATTTRAVATDTIEVRLVSLPLYADAEEIPRQASDGSVRTNAEILWADEPDRAISNALARNLEEITGAIAAVEPWPLEAFPEARIEVRVDEMLASANGTLRFAGAWFASRPGDPRADRAGRFAFDVPLADAAFPTLAAAHAEATRQLATTVAAGLR
ncbi:MAG: PqiC family protein [Pseudomonadota bacterium]